MCVVDYATILLGEYYFHYTFDCARSSSRFIALFRYKISYKAVSKPLPPHLRVRKFRAVIQF